MYYFRECWAFKSHGSVGLQIFYVPSHAVFMKRKESLHEGLFLELEGYIYDKAAAEPARNET